MIGRVYKIICSQSNEIYIGSTFNELRVRWKQHKDRYIHRKNDPAYSMSIHSYFDKFDINNFKMILIKEYEVVDRKHLESKEQLWINKLKCVNMQSSFNPLRQSHQAQKLYFAKHNSQKMTCLCGSVYRRGDKARHERTKKHQNYLSS